MPRQHPVLNIHELLEQTLLFLASPCDLLHMALVCRSFLGVALRVLWRCHQFSLGPLLRSAPKPILGHHSESEDNVSSPKPYKNSGSYSLVAWNHGWTTFRMRSCHLDAFQAICPLHVNLVLFR